MDVPLRRTRPATVRPTSALPDLSHTVSNDVTGHMAGRPTRIVRREPAIGSDGGVVSGGLESRIQSSGLGRPLGPDVRALMEPAFGADFSRGRIHTASDLPAQMNADAFTTGNRIHFAPGVFSPDTQAGAHVLAHELAHVRQQDTTVRRLYKFDDVGDNVVTTWKADALRAFTPVGKPNEIFTAAQFVVANLKRGFSASPLPVDFEVSAPWVRKRARDAVEKTYNDEMLPRRVRLTDVDKKLAKDQVKSIRTDLQRFWTDMVETLSDSYAAGKAELDHAAGLVAAEMNALAKTKKIFKKDKDLILAKYSNLTIYNEAAILKAANVKVLEANKAPLPWQANAKNTLTAEQLAMFEQERTMIEQRLAQWETKRKDGQGTNEIGTYGTSFGGSGTGFKHNLLPLAVYNALLEWWKTVKGPTWSSDSQTTDYSLKKQRVTPHSPDLSPRFNYHIELAAT